jgi:hypothetical protein
MDCDERPEDTEQQGMYTRVGVNNSLYIFFNAHAQIKEIVGFQRYT